MKYFTRQWCWGELSDAQIEKTSQRYDAYINGVYLKLPPPLKLLATSIHLHDGIIKKFTLSSSKKDLILSGIFGDLDIGYFKLKIKYKDIRNFNSEDTSELFMQKKMEIIRDEIGIEKSGIFVHRLIFSNQSEFQINFCECGLEIANATGKDYTKTPCSLVGF